MPAKALKTLSKVKLRILPPCIEEDEALKWKLLDDTPVIGEPMLKLVEFLHERELSVSGGVMFGRAVAFGNSAGLQHGKLLRDLEEDARGTTPSGWTKFSLLFPGTRYRRQDGHITIPELTMGSTGHLEWGYPPIDNDDLEFDSEYRIVVYKLYTRRS